METALLDRIQPDPDQPRTAIDPDRLVEFAAKLWVNGLVQPIVVTHLAPSAGETSQLEQLVDVAPDLLILAGERRFRAFLENRKRAAAFFDLSAKSSPALPEDLANAEKYNRWTEIPITLAESNLPPWRRIALQLGENEDREGLSLFDTATAWASAFEASGLNQKAFAKEVGLQRHYLQAYLQCAQATNAHLQHALRSALIRDPLAVSPFSRLSKQQQEALIRQATRTAQPISRSLASNALEAEEAAKARAREADQVPPPPPPPPPSRPEAPHPFPAAADQPVLPVAAASWLIDHLEGFAEPLAHEVHDALSQALAQGSPFILLRETGFDQAKPLASAGVSAH
jgi:ParB-like chromosome segregation protein Spo0J